MKAQFAAVPLRAISDALLTDRDFRILAVVASHDRMSRVRGKGQGAWASHRTMAAEVGGDGADYARFSVAMNKLVKLGYLERGPLAGDARRHAYRIIYTSEDRLQQRKQSTGDGASFSAIDSAVGRLPVNGRPSEIVCRGCGLSHRDDGETEPQYISQSEETDSAEAGKKDSAKAAGLTVRGVVRLEKDLSIDANLARLNRALQQGKEIAGAEWYSFLQSLDPQDVFAASHIHRLVEQILGSLTDAQFDEASRKPQSMQKFHGVNPGRLRHKA